MTTLRILYHEMTVYRLTIYHEMSLNKGLTSHILSVTTPWHLPLARHVIVNHRALQLVEHVKLPLALLCNLPTARHDIQQILIGADDIVGDIRTGDCREVFAGTGDLGVFDAAQIERIK